jgi:predicted site-specific integrase-resolvase
MYIISTREFRANQKKYFELAEKETVFVTRKNGKPISISVVNEEDIPKRDLVAELKGALQQVKEHLEGKRKLKTLDELINEL